MIVILIDAVIVLAKFEVRILILLRTKSGEVTVDSDEQKHRAVTETVTYQCNRNFNASIFL